MEAERTVIVFTNREETIWDLRNYTRDRRSWDAEKGREASRIPVIRRTQEGGSAQLWAVGQEHCRIVYDDDSDYDDKHNRIIIKIMLIIFIELTIAICIHIRFCFCSIPSALNTV